MDFLSVPSPSLFPNKYHQIHWPILILGLPWWLEDFTCGSKVKHLPAMQETRAQSLGWEDPLEKEMATHSSILTWKIPWTEEPGGLQARGSQREKRLSDFSFTFTFPGGSVVKNLPAKQETWAWSLDREKSAGEGNGNLLQHSYMGNPMGRGVWRATVHRIVRVIHDLATKQQTLILRV